MRRFVLLICLFIPLSYLFSQEKHTAEMMPDTTIIEEPTYEYWRPRYYDSIPVQQGIKDTSLLNFESMVSKYQSKDFEYVESISEKLNFLDELLNRFNRFIQDLFPTIDMGEYNQNWNYVLAGVGGIIILLLIYKLFFSGKKIYIKLPDEDQSDEDQVAYVERNLMHIDLKTYIQNALEKDNYALAIRYQQLLNIQILNDKGYIHWNHTKTNRELMEEVNNQELKVDFLKCSSIFDHVWFGNFPVSKEEYLRYEQSFTQFQARWI